MEANERLALSHDPDQHNNNRDEFQDVVWPVTFQAVRAFIELAQSILQAIKWNITTVILEYLGA